MTEYEIHHQEEESLFYAQLEGSQRAYLKYQRSGDESAVAQVDFYSTFVPDSHRGTGLAKQLVTQGFEWAEKNKLHINASCWYVANKLKKRQ